MYLVSLCFLCAADTVHCLAGYFSFPSPPPTIFSSLCILKLPESLPGKSCLGPLGVVCFLGNWRSSELDLFQFWTSDIQDLPTLYRKFLYFTSLFVFSVLHTKNTLKSAQFRRYSITFFDHFTVFPQNWVITEVLVCPAHALHEFIVLNKNKRPLYSMFVFLSFCAVFTAVTSWIVLIIHISLLSFHTYTITSSFLQSNDCPFSSTCLPLLGHVECAC